MVHCQNSSVRNYDCTHSVIELFIAHLKRDIHFPSRSFTHSHSYIHLAHLFIRSYFTSKKRTKQFFQPKMPAYYVSITRYAGVSVFSCYTAFGVSHAFTIAVFILDSLPNLPCHLLRKEYRLSPFNSHASRNISTSFSTTKTSGIHSAPHPINSGDLLPYQQSVYRYGIHNSIIP